VIVSAPALLAARATRNAIKNLFVISLTPADALPNGILRPPCAHILRDGLITLLDAEMTVEQTLPELMSPRQRAREAAEIIAAAIARLHSTRPRDSDIPLGFSPPERVHTNPSTEGVCK
jgi:hypothetical protein